MKAARVVGLSHYWAEFIPEGPKGYELLIGRQLGSFGPESDTEKDIGHNDLKALMRDVDASLTRAGTLTSGKLIVRFQQNY